MGTYMAAVHTSSTPEGYGHAVHKSNTCEQLLLSHLRVWAPYMAAAHERSKGTVLLEKRCCACCTTVHVLLRMDCLYVLYCCTYVLYSCAQACITVCAVRLCMCHTAAHALLYVLYYCACIAMYAALLRLHCHMCYAAALASILLYVLYCCVCVSYCAALLRPMGSAYMRKLHLAW
jgi:hypothetical protein